MRERRLLFDEDGYPNFFSEEFIRELTSIFLD